MRPTERTFVLAACLLLFVMAPAVAYANAGVPMLAFVWPLSWAALIPVVAIEGAIGRKMAGLGWGRAIGATAAANALSTFVGIPLTWGALVAVQMLIPNGGGAALGIDTFAGKLFAVTAQAGWLLPWEAHMYWMVPAALLFMLPFFGIVSVYTERPVFRWIARCEKDVARRWSWRANLTTYGIMIAAVAGWLVVALVRGS
jgi:hypothetical protein